MSVMSGGKCLCLFINVCVYLLKFKQDGALDVQNLIQRSLDAFMVQCKTLNAPCQNIFIHIINLMMQLVLNLILK